MIRKLIFIIALQSVFGIFLFGEEINLSSKETITVVELNAGDKLNYTLSSGRIISLELLDFRTDILLTSLDTLKKTDASEITIFSMTCTLRIDGEVMEMVRYIPVQETYYKPYVVNGLNIWFDALKELKNYFNENHGNCLPSKDARFAVQDAGKQICPQELSNWWHDPANMVYIEDGYMGEDSWLGPYFAADLHGGLDVNMPSNTPILAPIDFDEHYLFNSTVSGANNNRWRGIRNWKNGDIWYLQTHHINQLLIPQNKSIKQGEVYAYGAGTWCWYSPHSHFVFSTYQPQLNTRLLMDPWVIIWQIFENNRLKSNSIISNIEPVSPARTGDYVHFNSKGSRKNVYGGELEYFWDFGDGYTSFVENPVHVFMESGVYPVTLTVRNGTSMDSYTQHITISGEDMGNGYFRFSCEQEPSFRIRPAWKTSAYGSYLDIKNTLVFNSYQDSKGKPDEKILSLYPVMPDETNIKDNRSRLIRPQSIQTVYVQGNDWLEIEEIPFEDHLELKIKVNMEKVIVKWGFYEAYIMISSGQDQNNPQYIRVLLDINYDRPKSEVFVDNLDEECCKSDFYWLIPHQHTKVAMGYKKHYCISAGNKKGEYIRYTPNLEEGEYEVSLFGEVYNNPKVMAKTGSFQVIIHSADGLKRLTVKPAESLDLGTYHFSDGRNGYVEIISDDAEGVIVADAVKFVKN